jgi:DNA modification methylase
MSEPRYICGDGIAALSTELYDYIYTSPPCYEDLASFGVTLKQPETYRDNFLLPFLSKAMPRLGTITIAFTGARRHGGRILPKQWLLEDAMRQLGFYLRDIKHCIKSRSFNAYDHQLINILTFQRNKTRAIYNLQRAKLYDTYGRDIWGPFQKQIKVDGEVVGQPVQINQWCIENFTDKGHIVMDPFAGIATTGVAALTVGRGYIGYEIRPTIHEAGQARLRMVTLA